ncbi:M20/M25/M40 family metallo-hydrolase [Bacillus sp. H-16]|uniref:M20/M25/M40 family metallo-hydrolase n=1 Tax=Alteribacter salitolerans TaxID=2912333 RepID=UPI0019624F4A|nr:M20/M25/M40 family metallo-hydrolase [Alteribacter salitolerans]MBM7096932.1 M20/M25/M40 family metallo-hydrolase [Alteribacter salitolerans]
MPTIKRSIVSPVVLYEKVKDLPIPEQVEEITKTLVSINSINGTKGEGVIADFIIRFLTEIPYFKQREGSVWAQPLKNDLLDRKNVYAFLEGDKTSRKTVLYHSHIDTVGVDDFGENKELAFQPDRLKAQFADQVDNLQIREDALSNEWMFGRGALDMKSGIAVHLVNLMYFCERVKVLNGNILVMFNPVEENEHTGAIESVDVLLRLKEKEKLDFVAGINNDFVTSLYEGDKSKYIYTGAVGKLLPCFYISGREAHVGETLTSVDPTLISAEINRNLNNNMELAEDFQGELMLPPTCLYQRDNKDFYNVQTALTSYLYFNYFVYKDSPDQVMGKLLVKTKEACVSVEEHMKKQFNTFSRVTETPPATTLDWSIDVLTYEDYTSSLVKKGIDIDSITKKVVKKNQLLEKRELCFEIIRHLQEADPDQKPRVIIFFAPPYCPHNYLRDHVDKEAQTIEVIKEVLSQFEEETNETFKLKKFFPFLSDSSYLSLHDTNQELDRLIENFPEWEAIYPVPVHNIRRLNIPSINMGVYGQDAHKRTERVFMPYSFNILPKLIRTFTEKLLNQ